MTIKDIEKLTRSDVLDMSTAQLEKTLREINKQVRRREKTLKEKHLQYSPSLKSLKKHKFFKKVTRDKRYNFDKQESKYRGAMINKITHGKQFLVNKTSSVKGMNVYVKNIQKRLAMKKKPTTRFLKRFFGLYDEIKDFLNEMGNYMTSEEIQKTLYYMSEASEFKGNNWRETEQNVINEIMQQFTAFKKSIYTKYKETDTFTLNEDDEDENDDNLPW